MNTFKEWLSDNLRYLMLIAAVLLGVGIIMLSVKLVSRREVTAVSTGNTQTGADDENVIILLTEAEEKTPEKQTETESETQTEAVTEKETQTEKALTRPENETSTEKAAEKSSEKTTEKPQPETRRTAAVETEAETQKETQASPVVTAPQTTAGTEDAGEDHPEPEDAGSAVTVTETKEAEIDTLVMASADKYADTESNVRSGPGTEYDIVGGLNRGDSVHITGQTDNWYRIQTDNGTGYVSKSLLVDEYTPTYATIVSTCYVRSNDDYGDNIIMEVYGGTTVEVLSNPGGWAYISVDGVTGYVGSQFLG